VSAATSALHASDPPATTGPGFNVFGFLGDAWNASGGQVVGAGKGFVEGVWGAASGTAGLAWNGAWWTYHSTIAAVTDRTAFNAQWDTNWAVGGYVVTHPLESGKALLGGLVGPAWDKLSHGNVGEAFGELGGQVAFFGGIGKLVSLARGAAGLEEVAATADQGATLLADRMLPTPIVENVGLQNHVNALYSGTTNPLRVGNGTTMDAIRHELATGLPTYGRSHLLKGSERAKGLAGWLQQNPGAAYRDRLVAQSILDELRTLLQ
jgi:hypothetical protein